MKKLLFLILFVPSIGFATRIHVPANALEISTSIEGSNAFIWNTNELQIGSTFYVSSGTVDEQFIAHNAIIRDDDGSSNILIIEKMSNPAPSASGSPSPPDGLDDLTVSGNYTGNTNKDYVIAIDEENTPNTFSWSTDGGDSFKATGIAMTGSPQVLEDGISITWGSTTGHTDTDAWVFSVSRSTADYLTLKDESGTEIGRINSNETIILISTETGKDTDMVQFDMIFSHSGDVLSGDSPTSVVHQNLDFNISGALLTSLTGTSITKEVFGSKYDIDTTVDISSGVHSVYGGDVNIQYAGSIINGGSYLAYGHRTIVGGNAGTTGSTAKIGYRTSVTGTGDVNYGIFSSASGATTNWAGYFDGADMALDQDKKLYIGEAQDSYVEFDSNSMNIVANAVTSTDDMEFTAESYSLNTNADTDLVLNFIGTTNSGAITWLEDEAQFNFTGDVNISTGYFDKLDAPPITDSYRTQSFIPVVTADDKETPFYWERATTPLITPTSDASGDVLHPDIVYIPNAWNGWTYWMVITPFTGSSSAVENPEVLVSTNGTNWVVPSGGSNPIEAAPGSGFFSDPCIMFYENTMYVYWRHSVASRGDRIYMKSSTDGITWTSSTTVLDAGGGTAGTLVSPIVRNIYGDFFMWVVDTTASPRELHKYNASSPSGTFASQVTCVLTFGGAEEIWHINIMWDGDAFYAIWTNPGSLFFGRSYDGVNWDMNGVQFVTPTTGGEWDENKYQAAFIRRPDRNYFDVFYSAYEDTAVNLHRMGRGKLHWTDGDDFGNLHGYVDAGATTRYLSLKDTFLRIRSDIGLAAIILRSNTDDTDAADDPRIHFQHGATPATKVTMGYDSSLDTFIIARSHLGSNIGISLNSTGQAIHTKDIYIDANSEVMGFGTGSPSAPEYYIYWNGTHAVHTVLSGSHVFNGGSFGVGAVPSELIQATGASGLDGATPTALRLYSTTTGNWTSDAIFAELQFANADGSGAGAGGVKAKIAALVGETSATWTELAFYTSTDGTNIAEQVRIDRSGNVGIGEASPQDKLEVNGTGLFKDKLKFTQDDGDEYIDSLNDGYLDYSATTAHRFNSSPANTDIRMEFVETTNSGLFTWMEDEDWFEFADIGMFNSSVTIQDSLYVDNLAGSGAYLQFNAGNTWPTLVLGSDDPIGSQAYAMDFVLQGAVRDSITFGLSGGFGVSVSSSGGDTRTARMSFARAGGGDIILADDQGVTKFTVNTTTITHFVDTRQNDDILTKYGTVDDANIGFDGDSLNIIANAVVAGDDMNFTADSFTFNTSPFAGYYIRAKLAATDDVAMEMDGTTNDYTGTGGAYRYCMLFKRDLNAGNGNHPTSFIAGVFSTRPKHTDAVIDAGSIVNEGVLGEVINSGTWSLDGGTNKTVTERAVDAVVTDTANYDTTGTALLTNYQTGVRGYLNLDQTYTDTSTSFNRAYTTGLESVINNNPTLDSGSLTIYNRGVSVDVTGTTVGSQYNYGIYGTRVTGADANWFIWDASEADWAIDSDSQKVYWGEVQDSYVEFDGNSMNIVANAVTATDDMEFTADQYTFKTQANTDLVTNWAGTTNSGVLTWMEDEDWFDFANAVTFSSHTYRGDNIKSILGTGDDVSHYWDADDWIFDLSLASSAAGNPDFVVKLWDNAGTSFFHIFDSDDVTQLNINSNGDVNMNGDILFTGAGGGMAYACISTTSNTTEIAIGGAGTPVQVTTFGSNDPSNNATPDHTNDHITIVAAGDYHVFVSATVNSVVGAASKFEIMVKKNNGASDIIPHMDRNLGGGGVESGVISMNGIATLAAADTIEVWIENETNTQNYVVEDICLSLFQMGGP